MACNKAKLLLCVGVLIGCIIMFSGLVSASSDVSVWQGQYYTGTTFNTGTYYFNFSVYDALTGGDICYSNTAALTTGSFGEWKTEQSGVNSACNNVSKDYYLNININGADQTPRRRLVIWNSLRKNVDETTSGKLQIDTQVIAPVVQANTQIIAPVVNATQLVANEITVSSNANILGTLRGHSPLKIGDAIQFIDKNDSNLFSIYTAGQNITGSNVSSQYYGVIIHQIELHTNPSGIEECWWDREDQQMRMCMDKTNMELWNSLLVNKDATIAGNVNASNYTLNGTTIRDWSDVSSRAESDPLWAANYSLVAFRTDLGNYYDKTESDSRYLKTSGPQTLDGNLNVNGDVTFVGSYTNLTVQTITTNGSIVPGYDSMFDVGSPSFQFNNIYGNLNASYVQNAPWLTSYDETDPMWAANSSTVARTGNCPAGQVVQNTTTSGVQCMTPASGGLAPVYLGSKLTATNAAYTTIFAITLTPSKMNVIQAYLAQSSSTNGVAIRNRVIVNASGPVGNCHFVTQTGSTAQAINNIAVSNSSANTGESTMSLSTNVPFINTVTCTVLADANEKNLVIQFESENANNVTTYAGSYYTNAVN